MRFEPWNSDPYSEAGLKACSYVLFTGLEQLRGGRRLPRVELETAHPDKTERSEGLAGWTGLEPVLRAFHNQLTTWELWSQVLQYVSVLNKWDVNVRLRETSRVAPVRGDILETI